MSNFKFSASTTADEIISALGVNLDGKNVFVTGASSGIGVECARVFASVGANVWLAGRDVAKTTAVADAIRAQTDPSRVHVIALDLSDLSSVRTCISEFVALGLPLHVLLNNAGCMAVQDRQETKDGFEMQFGTNHIGHFVLTNGLLDCLKAAGSSRVVNVSSMAHHRGGINFEDPQFSRSYDPWRAYGQSKTANILHACELNNRFADSHGIVAVSLHPGVIETELWRHAGVVYPANKTIPQGAATSVFCCVSPTIQGGRYYNDCQESSANAWATDSAFASQFWQLSLALTESSV